MKNIKTSLIIYVLFFSCFSSHSDNSASNKIYYYEDFYQYVKKYDKILIDSIIQNNDSTIIFAWTEWCKGSHNRLKNLIPVLNKKPVNIGIISIYCGNINKLAEILEENDYKYTVFLHSSSLGGIDKIKFNILFCKLFNNYKSVNYVPIEIICNSQKQILNTDTIIYVNYEYNEGVAFYPVLELFRK